VKTIRNLAIGAAAILVLGLITAASASAEFIQATQYPAEVKAEREGEVHIFTVEGFAVKCETASFKAELPEPVETLEVAPQYEKCTSLGSAASVTMEGCKYRLDANATDVDLVCPAGKKLKIVALAGNCEVQIGSQNAIEKDEYVNHAESPKTVTVKFKSEKVKYTKTKDGFICPLSGLGEKSDGAYTGNMLAKAFAGSQVGFFQGAAAPTKLCAEEILACPEGQTYPGTAFKANATAGELILLWAGKPNSILECGKWTLSGSTGVAQGAPELGTSSSLGFNSCAITAGTAAGSKCTVSMSTGGGSLLAVGNGKDGRWKLGQTSLVISACTGVPQMSKCEFAESPAVTLRGGLANSATVEADRTFQYVKSGPGDSCPTLGATWKVTYVLNPEEGAGNIFVTN
jgi:hypothetical protein